MIKPIAKGKGFHLNNSKSEPCKEEHTPDLSIPHSYKCHVSHFFGLNRKTNVEKLTFCALSFWKTNTGGAMAGLSVKRRRGLVIQAPA